MILDIMPIDAQRRAKKRIKKALGVSHWQDIDSFDEDNFRRLCQREVADWWLTASDDDVFAVIDTHDDKRVQALCALLCAESVGHLTNDPRVSECRRVKLAWVRGEADDAARFAARAEAWDAARVAARIAESATEWDAAMVAASAAAWAGASAAAKAAASAAARVAAWDAARVAATAKAVSALVDLLRYFLNDPSNVSAGVLLLRWDEYAGKARKLFLRGGAK